MRFQTDSLVNTFRTDQLNVYTYQSRVQMERAAASAAAAEIRRLIGKRGRAIGIFASARSQNEFLEALVTAEGIEWTRVIGFQFYEYLGLDEDSPQSFRKPLIDRLVSRVPMAEFHGIRGEAANARAVCANYAAMLKSRPPDFGALGIGENGHLGFNDPLTCDFTDPQAVKIVEIDQRRQKEVGGDDGKFDEVPRQAITLTIPAIMSCPRLYVIVYGKQKAKAVRDAIRGEIATACPASILRTHSEAHLFLDLEAAEML